jgi:hypothetical protein
MKKSIAFLFAVFTISVAMAQQHITSPELAFGFKPGTDRKLADWNELTAYFKKLGSESDRIRYQESGKTTEGRPFITVTISSADNLAHLERYKEIQRKLADPRTTSPEEAKKLIAEGKTVLVVTCNVHSTEIASSQSATEFAYQLAAGDTPKIRSILDNVIIVLVPSLNPDGQQLVVDWYKKYLGTPYEGSNPVVVWHHYVGHDDNRDWSSFTQVETRLAVEKVINPWHPQILYDIHQMGSNGPRIYLPPWVDPIDPNVDPILVESMNALGTETALEIGQTGKQGVLIHGVYDFWSPLRDYISLHNGLRVLTESASVNIATPINIPFDKLDRGIGYDSKVSTWNFPDPWKGGEWHLRDIVDYQLDAFFSIANHAVKFRERYLSNFYQIGLRAVNRSSGPYAYVIPAEQTDSAVTARLINILRTGGVEVERATADFEADGQHYGHGSYIVVLGQPYGNFTKTLLEVQDYPNIPKYPGGRLQRPNDVTAQTLPLLFGVTADAIKNKFTVASSNVDVAKPDPGHFNKSSNGNGYLIADTTNSSLYALFALLAEGVRAYRLTGAGSEAGTIYIPKQDGIDVKLLAIAGKFPVDIRAAASSPKGDALLIHLPRIGLYQSWVASMDEGWTRWIFDQNAIPYTRLTDGDIRKGDLNQRFDVILIPDNSAAAITSGRRGFGEDSTRGSTTTRGSGSGSDVQQAPGEASRPRAVAEDNSSRDPQVPPEFSGGLGSDGVASLKAFTEAGGTIVTLNKASEIYAKKDSGQIQNALASVDRKSFFIPGSILQISVDPSNPIAFGSTLTVPIFYENGPTFKVNGDARSIGSFTTEKPLLSGWILGGQFLKGTSVITEEPVGRGRIILFGFRPQYRAQSEVTYKFLFNALLYSSSKAVSLGESAAQLPPSGAATTRRKGGE